jgi:hypothetical protein
LFNHARAMSRKAFQAAVIVSILIGTAAAVLWIRSYGGSDYVERMTPTGQSPGVISHELFGVQITRGEMLLIVGRHSYYPPFQRQPASGERASSSWSWGRLGAGHLGWDGPPPPRSWWNRLGFAIYEDGTSASFYDESRHIVATPMWVVMVSSLVLPTAWLRGWTRRRRRAAAGLCVRCGYDLRATPQRCPECGAER